MKLLLDTRTLIWLLTGEKPLSARARTAIETGEVSLSAVSAWEIAIKGRLGKLRLPSIRRVGCRGRTVA